MPSKNYLPKSQVEREYVAAAQALADARVRFANQFTLARHILGDKATDGQATQAAIGATADEITVLTAKLQIARQHAVELVWSLEDPQ